MRGSGLKRILASLLVVGAVGGILGGGVFATFNAQTTNSSNTFSTGTLVLSDKKDSGTACLSTGGGTTDTNSNSVGCEDLIAGAVRKPGDSTSHTVTIQNVGSLAASTSELWSAACTNSNNAESYHGTGNPCSSVQLTVHDDTNGNCIYPTAVFGTPQAGACTASATKTLADFATNSTAAHISLGSFATGAAVVYTITATLPSTADNSYQGRQGVIDFNWKISQ